MKSQNITTLSGYEGAGKTTILQRIQSQHNVFIVPEVARLLIPLKNTLLADSKDDLSYQSFTAYISTLHFIAVNQLQNVVYDRNIIDSLTYLEVFASDQSIPLDSLQSYINRFLDDHGMDTLYDTVVLLKHPKDESYIRDCIMADKERLYSPSVAEYKANARRWEDIYCSILSQLDRVCRKFERIAAYPENETVVADVTRLVVG